jgi:hypothetical protein
MMAALVLLAVIVFWTVPWLFDPDHPRGTSSDTSAIGALRNLIIIQDLVRKSGRIDVDGDGLGEFATFGELTGVSGVRTSALGPTAGRRMEPPYLNLSLAPRADRPLVTRSGWCYRIFLPSGPSTAATEVDPGKPFSAPVATDLAELHWCAYAWPEDDKLSRGAKAFYVDEAGDVWWCFNRENRYSGASNAPSWDAALPAGGDQDWRTRRSASGPGRDGEIWEKAW